MENISIDKASDKQTTQNLGEINQNDVNALKHMAAEAKFTEGGARPFMEPQSKTEKKKRGPYTKKGQEPAQPNTAPGPGPTGPAQPFGVPGSEVIKPLFEVASAMFARATNCKGVALLPEEIKSLSDSWGVVLDKRAPAVLNNYGDIVGALAVTAMITVRIKTEMDKEIAARKKYAAEQAAKRAFKEAAVDPNTQPTPHASIFVAGDLALP